MIVKQLLSVFVALAPLTACATATQPLESKTQNVWVLDYSAYDDFSKVQQAAATCRYNDVNEVVGGHVEPYLHIVIPNRFSAEYECLRQWFKVNKQLGLRVPPASKR
jgi:hypothetical protein